MNMTELEILADGIGIIENDTKRTPLVEAAKALKKRMDAALASRGQVKNFMLSHAGLFTKNYNEMTACTYEPSFGWKRPLISLDLRGGMCMIRRENMTGHTKYREDEWEWLEAGEFEKANSENIFKLESVVDELDEDWTVLAPQILKSHLTQTMKQKRELNNEVHRISGTGQTSDPSTIRIVTIEITE